MRKTFTFTVWYFKPSGKFYASADFPLEVAAIGPDESHPYMHDAQDFLTDLRLNGKAAEPMPGLTGKWFGPMLVNHPDGFPCLIHGLDRE